MKIEDFKSQSQSYLSSEIRTKHHQDLNFNPTNQPTLLMTFEVGLKILIELKSTMGQTASLSYTGYTQSTCAKEDYKVFKFFKIFGEKSIFVKARAFNLLKMFVS
jgi:hypothetical protein